MESINDSYGCVLRSSAIAAKAANESGRVLRGERDVWSRESL